MIPAAVPARGAVASSPATTSAVASTPGSFIWFALSASPPASPKPQPARYSLANLLALLFLTLAWGGNWPVAKLGVSAMPPLWFRALGTAGGVLVLYCFARLRGINLFVPRGMRIRLVALALPNMVLWYALVSIALVTVPAGARCDPWIHHAGLGRSVRPVWYWRAS